MKNLLTRKTLFTLLTFAVFGLGAAVSAKADPVTIAQGGSATFIYQTSNPSVRGTATFSLSGNVLTVVYSNTSVPGACTAPNCSITGIGFDTTPNITVTSTVLSGARAGDWAYDTNGCGLGGFEHRDSVCGGGVSQGLRPGETQTAMMTFSGLAPGASLTIDLTQMHFQSMPGTGDSEKPTGVITTVPEPATMLLLGTGLTGVAAKVRRRRKIRDVEQA